VDQRFDDPLQTARSLLSQLGHPYARCARARDGREHHLFRIHLPDGERLLKFPREDAYPDPYPPERTSEERLGAEAYAVSLVRNVPVADPYIYYDTNPRCVVMGVIPGNTAEVAYERGGLDEESLLGVCLQMGRMLANVHARKRPDGPDYLPDLPESDPATNRLVHMDFHLGNVIGKPQLGGAWAITGVVDWTRARWGPPEADFVEMQVSVFALNPRSRDAFVAGYRQVSARAVDIAEVERRAAAEITRRLVTEPPADDVLRRRWQDWVDRRKA
jgi:hypothetical protein